MFVPIIVFVAHHLDIVELRMNIAQIEMLLQLFPVVMALLGTGFVQMVHVARNMDGVG